MAKIVLDYLDLMIAEVSESIDKDINSFIEINNEPNSNHIFKAYLKQVVNKIYYQVDLLSDVYQSSRKLGINKKRHDKGMTMINGMMKNLDHLIKQSGHAESLYDAHRIFNK